MSFLNVYYARPQRVLAMEVKKPWKKVEDTLKRWDCRPVRITDGSNGNRFESFQIFSPTDDMLTGRVSQRVYEGEMIVRHDNGTVTAMTKSKFEETYTWEAPEDE